MGVLPPIRARHECGILRPGWSETFDLVGLNDAATPGAPITFIVHRTNGQTDRSR
jgi:hypothetical protein